MLEIIKTVLPSPEQWEIIIEGMRNPMNSWDKMDSYPAVDCGKCGRIEKYGSCEPDKHCSRQHECFHLGDVDHDLMMRLAKGGPVHGKYRRMIPVFLTINAPLYWWKEFDTYKVGTVANSCSTMHKIQAKEFTLHDFSHENLITNAQTYNGYCPLSVLECVIGTLNEFRKLFLETGNKAYWWQMIQMLPSSYNQKRTVMLNYEVLHNIYHSRKNHKLDEWHTFCDWIEQLPYSEIITIGG